jgi:pimeloyl-ACP methyl ester carboxylesterase
MFFPWLALLPVAMAPVDSSARSILTAPAESLRVTTSGPETGPVVVIIPGIVSPAYAFRHVLPPLAAAGIRTVVIEPLGFGQSSRPGDASYSFTSQAIRVAAVMDSLGAGHAVVLGHVAGAAIALRLALLRPDLVARLLLVEGGAAESAAVPTVRKVLKFAPLVRIFSGRGRVRKEVRKGLVSSSGDTTWVTDSVVGYYTEGQAGDVSALLRAFRGMQRAVEPDSLVPQLHSVAMPVRLLLGAAPHNTGMGQNRIRELEDHLPSLTIDSIVGAGMHINEEQPQVIVAALEWEVKEDHRDAKCIGTHPTHH